MASWAHSSNVLRLTKLLLTSVFSVNRTEKEDVFFFPRPTVGSITGVLHQVLILFRIFIFLNVGPIFVPIYDQHGPTAENRQFWREQVQRSKRISRPTRPKLYEANRSACFSDLTKDQWSEIDLVSSKVNKNNF